MRLHHSLISDIYDIWIFSVYMIEYYQYQKAWINIYDQLQLNYYGLLIWSNLKFWTQIRENNTDKNKLLEKRNENFHCVSWIVCINWLLRNHVCGYLRATMSRLYVILLLWSSGLHFQEEMSRGWKLYQTVNSWQQSWTLDRVECNQVGEQKDELVSRAAAKTGLFTATRTQCL